jgi:anti-anti-sigma factor
VANPPQLQVLPAENNTLRLIGELDMQTVAVFESAVAERAPKGALTLDIAELSFIDSTGLHAFLKRATVPNGGGQLTIVNTPTFIRRVFEVVGLDNENALKIT